MKKEEYINKHPEQFKDDIDKWLFNEFGIMGGCCSSQGSLEYSVARKVVERWEKKEEPESKDLEDEIDIYTEYLDPKDIKNAPFAHIEECARHFAKWQKEQIIDKACKWLKSYRQDTYDGTGYIAGIVNDKTIEEFKKAMEEQL